MITIVTFLTALAVTFLSAPLLRRLAFFWGVVDAPSDRKLQKEAIPLLGGVAVYLGVLAVFLLHRGQAKALAPLILGSTLVFLVSLWDDKAALSARLRIFVQLVAATLLIGAGLRISFVPNGPVWDALEVLITLMWILGITNAFNYLDGADALCSGVGAIVAFFYTVVLYTTNQPGLLFMTAAIAGACVGFIPHNLKRAKMFLGDAGSMFIGFMMAGISLMGEWASQDIVKVSIPILLLGVPIFDMTFTTIMRTAEGKIHNVVEWLEYAGRDHFHHYLMDLGLKSGGAVMFIWGVIISLGMTAFLITKASDPLYGIVAVLKGMITFALIAVLMVLGRRLHGKVHDVKERAGI
jgi:UDP-GlcNAc:undecaprenyl-phosphate GlcNAc-1-phosphate transferase